MYRIYFVKIGPLIWLSSDYLASLVNIKVEMVASKK